MRLLQLRFWVFLLAGLVCLTALAGTIEYTYDEAGRLIKADYGDGKTITYTYDNNGNLLERIIAAGPVVPGDANGDGIVSIGEVQQAINMFLGTQPIGNNVDCGDGNVTIGDIQRVINAFLGEDVTC